MSFEYSPVINKTVTDAPSIILTDAEVNQEMPGAVYTVRVSNTGSAEVSLFPANTPDVECIFADGWGPIQDSIGYIEFTVDNGDIPDIGLKAVCDTGQTTTVKVNRA